MKQLFLALTIIGILVPYLGFAPFVVEHGFNIPLFLQQASVNSIAAFAWLDVVISALVLFAAVFIAKLVSLKQGLFVLLLTCLAGVSAGLPLFLYFFIARSEKHQSR
mgnify:CR=1 FL=1